MKVGTIFAMISCAQGLKIKPTLSIDKTDTKKNGSKSMARTMTSALMMTTALNTVDAKPGRKLNIDKYGDLNQCTFSNAHLRKDNANYNKNQISTDLYSPWRPVNVIMKCDHPDYRIQNTKNKPSNRREAAFLLYTKFNVNYTMILEPRDESRLKTVELKDGKCHIGCVKKNVKPIPGRKLNYDKYGLNQCTFSNAHLRKDNANYNKNQLRHTPPSPYEPVNVIMKCNRPDDRIINKRGQPSDLREAPFLLYPEFGVNDTMILEPRDIPRLGTVEWKDGECHIGCMKKQCSQPMNEGTYDYSDKMSERWYYDPNRAQCFKFTYSGEGGNRNNFTNEIRCKARCGRETRNNSKQGKGKRKGGHGSNGNNFRQQGQGKRQGKQRNDLQKGGNKKNNHGHR